MSTKAIWSIVMGAGLALSACGTVDSSDSGNSGVTPGDTDGATGTDGTGTGGQIPMTGGGPGLTSPPPDTDGLDTGSDTGVTFIQNPDGGGVAFECDIFTQDCPEGEKCMPWASTGGTWDATRCSPIADNPGQSGDPCTVEGSGASGVDDCDIGVMCWDVDPETNTGTCVDMCTGDDTNPICEDPDTTCSIANNGAIVLCLPVCDPLIQDCVEGQACYPVNEDWVCGPDASGEMGAYGDPCEFINVCDAGLFCAAAAAVPNCVGASGCCSEVCDLSLPDPNASCSGSADGQECVPWYDEAAAPPGYEDVGGCAIPA